MIILQYIDHFVKSATTTDGYGVFYKDIHATELAKGLSKMQFKKYKRYGIVPAAFFIWLREASIVKSSMKIPRGGTSKDDFLKILAQNYVPTEQQCSAREYKEKMRIQKYCAPELNRAFANQDHVWDAIICS